MVAIRTTQRMLSAYADHDGWNAGRIEAQASMDLEEKLAWGVHIYQGLLDLEERAQSHAIRQPGAQADQLIELIPLLYQLWATTSDAYLERARMIQAQGYAVEGIDRFEATVEEARTLISNLALEEEIRPIEELLARARPDNPRPARYGD
jgi:hypothetical protein